MTWYTLKSKSSAFFSTFISFPLLSSVEVSHLPIYDDNKNNLIIHEGLTKLQEIPISKFRFL